MKKTIFIISSVFLIAFTGYFIRKSTCHDSCDYNNKMSMVCEFSCAAKDVDDSKVVAQSKAKIGDYTKCPISGVVFNVTEQSSKISYAGKTAFTCCSTCAEIFNKSPQEYASNMN